MAVSALCALIYGIWHCHGHESPLRTVIKTGAIAALALIAVLEGGPLLLVLALVCSASGDLALSRPGDRAFLFGLCSFALAHLFYICLFTGLAEGWPAVLPALILVFFACSTEIWLAPYTKDMHWPVRIYVVLIAGMGITALALPGTLYLALIGAVAFMASDTLLAVQMFRLSADSLWQVTFSRALWALYYLAQMLITWAILG